MTFLPFLLNRSRLPICSYKCFLFWPVTLKSVKKKKKKSIYACVLITKISKKKKKYYFFLFWPVTLQTLNGSSTILVSKASQLLSCLFCLHGQSYQYALTIFFYFGLFVFLTDFVTLQTLHGSSTVLVST